MSEDPLGARDQDDRAGEPGDAQAAGDAPAAGAASEPGEAQAIRLRADDGVEVVGDLVAVAGAWAGAVVCHPHPAYGGDRHNAVVDRIFHALAGAGVTVVRFDFRRGGDGDGGEQPDVLAALQRIKQHVAPELPLWLVGYSFGADLALSVGDERVAGWAAVAPPLHFGPPPRPAGGDPRPVLVVAAEHDQFCSPARLREATSAWPDAAVTLTVVPSADHFLLGAASHVADTILAWLRDQTSRLGGNVPPSRP